MNKDIKIIVQILHWGSHVVAWVAYNEKDIIDVAFNDGLLYEKWTKEKIIDTYGEDLEDSPFYFSDCLELLENSEEVIQICLNEASDGEFYEIDDAPSLYEAAVMALSEGQQSLKILSIREAKKFVKNYKGHLAFEAIAAVKKELKDLI